METHIKIWVFSYILTLFPLGASMELHCIKTDKCDCTSSFDHLEMNCRSNLEDEDFVMNIEKLDNSSNWMIEIDCFNNADYVDILPTMFVPNVIDLRIQSCPLPKYGFQNFLNNFNVTNLQYLRYESFDIGNRSLSGNYFTGLDTVNTLILSDNNLKNIDADIFHKFTNLRYLDLYKNYIPLNTELFTHLGKLTRLSLGKNNINYIPDDVFQNLKHLQILEIWGNKISEINERSFSGLQNLIILELSYNEISRIEVDAFNDLVNLAELSLAFNKIKFLPKDIFSKNKYLEKIRFMNNPLKHLSDFQFNNLPNLIEINLSDLQIEEIPGNIFWFCKKLEKVDLSHNHLHAIPQYLFRDSSSLERLDLSFNKLRNISTETFENLNKLKILRLDYNFLDEIPERLFSKLENVIDINLNNNDIRKIHPLSFVNNKNLQILLLSYNKFDIEHNIVGATPFDPLEKLRTLDLSHNRINELNIREFTISKNHLHMLDVSYNNISYIEVSDFVSPFTSYDLVVDLSHNIIEEVFFPPYLSDQLPEALETDTLHQVKSRTQIILSNNPIRCDCRAFDLSQYLKGLLDEPLKKTVEITPDDLFCAYPNHLKNISVIKVPDDEFVCPCSEDISEDCSCIWRAFDGSLIVSCTDRNLTDFPNITLPKHHDKLEVDLSNNLLTTLYEKQDYENVTRLILSNNFIDNVTWIPPHIEVLHLDHNNLSRLDSHALEIFNRSQTLFNLTLNDNPWTCGCPAKNFVHFLRSTKKVDGSDIKCRENNKTIKFLNDEYLCYRGFSIWMSVIIILSAILLFMSLAAIYMNFSREIKVWLFAKNLCLWFITEEELDKDKIYDAFISYSHKDEEIVESFVEMLENCPQPYKLCLHNRNFIPGKLISEQIIESVSNSKRTIIILSKHFLESVWAKIEFQAAHLQALEERRSKVIVVLCGDLDINALDNDLKLYLKTNTYLKWGDPWFWKKLRYALPHENKRRQNDAKKYEDMMTKINRKLNFAQEPCYTGIISFNQDIFMM